MPIFTGSLTGERVIGIGDAAGMFPIDSKTYDYDEDMVQNLTHLQRNISIHGNLEIFSESTYGRRTGRRTDRSGCCISG